MVEFAVVLKKKYIGIYRYWTDSGWSVNYVLTISLLNPVMFVTQK